MTFTNLQPRPHRLSDFMGRVIDMDLTELWMKAIKSVLSLLILTILIALTGGVIGDQTEAQNQRSSAQEAELLRQRQEIEELKRRQRTDDYERY